MSTTYDPATIPTGRYCDFCGRPIMAGLICMIPSPSTAEPNLYFCSVDCKRAKEREMHDGRLVY